MCGRFSLGLPHAQIQQLDGYNTPVGDWIGQDHFQPRHNIAPHSNAPVLRRKHSSGSAGEEVVLQTMQWGLVPHWAKHEDKTLNTTNARSENLVDGGGMWGTLKGRKRCAIPCEGYYEWLKKGKERLPHFTKRKDGKLMLLAGLYDVVTLEGQLEPLWTFTIVTTSANKEFSWLHDRQPVILSCSASLSTWLDTSSQTWTAALTKLVNPYSNSQCPLECYQVPKEVGKVGAESSSFIKPISQRKDGLQAMFAKQAKRAASTPTKRKRSPSSNAATSVSDDDVQIMEPASSQPRAKAQKLNTWEDDSDVEYVDHQPALTKSRAVISSGSKSKPLSQAKLVGMNVKYEGDKKNDLPSSSKITAFFSSQG